MDVDVPKFTLILASSSTRRAVVLLRSAEARGVTMFEENHTAPLFLTKIPQHHIELIPIGSQAQVLSNSNNITLTIKVVDVQKSINNFREQVYHRLSLDWVKRGSLLALLRYITSGFGMGQKPHNQMPIRFERLAKRSSLCPVR